MVESSLLHLAIIPDGNRRWAKKRRLQPWKGHETAIEKFRSITEWCRKDPRVGILTVWCFSTENWKRDSKEISMLMEIYEKYLRQERNGFIEHKTRFIHSGRRDRIPKSLSALIEEVEDATKNQTEFILNLAVDYGGKDELIRAIRKLRQPDSVTEESFRRLLDHPELPDVDMIIRTSGEQRTSNFFMWETAYAEWVFLKKHFPELTVNDIKNAVDEFAGRTRRFGS
ncbi:di-trans,poly-cis-decaprenylcistransferase [Candidatus Peregrinibacteria bacterium]|nr:di-trans,poly-cis-decaprenylcistransferase [Candidatus Peregrinibacteria bacterium]